ncbi:STAS domain-containing protein [Actinosynnema sp. NPDC020468]|uniref:STAS domain-containing protein n=1 Tax=Actinosynnema sp. NPDC020468 TaxID=3154488 RepID=UPI0033F899DD
MTSTGRTGGLDTTTRRIADDLVVLTVRGEIDIATAEGLRTPLVALAGESPCGGVVVADLGEVGFFSSAGIEALLVAHEKLSHSDGLLRVVTAPVVRRALVAVGLHRALELHDSLDTALATRGSG